MDEITMLLTNSPGNLGASSEAFPGNPETHTILDELLARDASLELCDAIATTPERNREACIELCESIVATLEFNAVQRKVHNETRRAMMDLINAPFERKSA
jgi:hypothetical protein